MPRKREVRKREIAKDPKYHDALMAKFINGIMRQGKKYVAETIFYNALNIIKEKTHADPVKTFKQAMENVKPLHRSETPEGRGRHVSGSCGSEAVEKNGTGHSVDH